MTLVRSKSLEMVHYVIRKQPAEEEQSRRLYQPTPEEFSPVEVRPYLNLPYRIANRKHHRRPV